MWQIFNAVNAHRARNGRSMLDQNFGLHQRTQPHSILQSENGKTFHSDIRQLVGQLGRAAAENVAQVTDPGRIVALWEASPGHNRNMLGSYSSANVGLAYAKGYYYCTMIYVA